MEQYSKEAQRAVIFLDSFRELDYKYKLAVLMEVGDPAKLYESRNRIVYILEKALGSGKASALLQRLVPEGEEEVLFSLKKAGIMPVTRKNKYYPDALEQTTAPPLVLYTKGNLELLKNRKFSIVGSRKTPVAETRLTEEFSEKIADYMTVVTGTAEGADAAVIRGALKKKNVISVFASGLDTFYPECNRGLLSAVSENGLILSEYPPGVPALKFHFPVRNRIIAGLSEGTLVVSAREKSGALYTASYAATYNRDVYAFPYKVGDAAGKGCNALIKQGATLCDGAEDLLSAYGFEVEDRAPELPLTDEEKKILSFLREEELSADVIAEKTDIPVFLLLPALSSLEISGHIVKAGADSYRALK